MEPRAGRSKTVLRRQVSTLRSCPLGKAHHCTRAVVVALQHRSLSKQDVTDEIYIQGGGTLPVEMRNVDGQSQYFVKLSQLLPVAIDNASTPIKR